MQFETWVFFQPGRHLWCLVGGVVVEHQAHFARLWHHPVDAAQEPQELLGAVAGQASADDHAGLYIERREQRRRAMALVIVGHRKRSLDHLPMS